MPSRVSFDGASKHSAQSLSIRKRINFDQPRANFPRKISTILFWAWKENLYRNLPACPAVHSSEETPGSDSLKARHTAFTKFAHAQTFDGLVG